jgi:hypothetical protein
VLPSNPLRIGDGRAANYLSVGKGGILLKNSIFRVYHDSGDRRQSRREYLRGSAKQSVLPRVTPHTACRDDKPLS